MRRKRFSNSLLCQLVISRENWFLNYNLRSLGIPRNLLLQETEDQKAGPYIPPREQRPGGGSTPTLRSFSTCRCALRPPRYSSGPSLGGEGWGPELGGKRASGWVLLLLAYPLGKLCPCSPHPTPSRRRKAREGLLSSRIRLLVGTLSCPPESALLSRVSPGLTFPPPGSPPPPPPPFIPSLM